MTIACMPDNWKGAIIVSIFKWNGSKSECKNYTLLIAPRRTFGRILLTGFMNDSDQNFGSVIYFLVRQGVCQVDFCCSASTEEVLL